MENTWMVLDSAGIVFEGHAAHEQNRIDARCYSTPASHNNPAGAVRV